MTTYRDIRHLRTTASVYKNGFLVASCGTKYITHRGDTDQILFFAPVFELYAPTNTSFIFKRTLDTLSQHTHPYPKQVFLPWSPWMLIRRTLVHVLNSPHTSPFPAWNCQRVRPNQHLKVLLMLFLLCCVFTHGEESMSCLMRPC